MKIYGYSPFEVVTNCRVSFLIMEVNPLVDIKGLSQQMTGSSFGTPIVKYIPFTFDSSVNRVYQLYNCRTAAKWCIAWTPSICELDKSLLIYNKMMNPFLLLSDNVCTSSKFHNMNYTCLRYTIIRAIWGCKVTSAIWNSKIQML